MSYEFLAKQNIIFIILKENTHYLHVFANFSIIFFFSMIYFKLNIKFEKMLFF